MIIEKVTADDAEKLLEIYTPYVEKTAISFEYEAPSLEEFRQRISDISAKLPYIKAVNDDGETVGYAYADTFKSRKAYDMAVEVAVYVREDCKRGGIGRMLYNALERSLSAMGIQNMNACIAVPAQRTPYLTEASFVFHNKMGFKLVGKFHKIGYKFNTWFDMVWMEKFIGDHGKKPKEIIFGEWRID